MLAQGFLFTRALPPQELHSWLATHLTDGKRLSLAP
jgi:sensor c-di-GMP phosphodiesterase-like protein